MTSVASIGAGPAPARGNRACDKRRGQHLACPRDRVEQSRRQLMHHRQAVTQLLEAIETSIDLLERRRADRRVLNHRVGDSLVPVEQALA